MNDVTGNICSGVISIIDDVGITCTDEDSINDDVIKISISDDVMESSTFDETSISDDVIEDSMSNDVITVVNARIRDVTGVGKTDEVVLSTLNVTSVSPILSVPNEVSPLPTDPASLCL